MARTVGSSAPETRRRILDSAAELFAEHGYSGARMLDIAERLGISKSALYYHFASKEDLLDGLVHPVLEATEQFARAAESGGTPPEQIVRGYLDHMIVGLPALHPLMIDPAAREAIKARFSVQDLMRRIENALTAAIGGGPDSRVRAQFALGGLRAVPLTRLFAGGRSRCAPAGEAVKKGPDDEPLLTGAEREALVQAALAALGPAGAA